EVNVSPERIGYFCDFVRVPRKVVGEGRNTVNRIVQSVRDFVDTVATVIMNRHRVTESIDGLRHENETRISVRSVCLSKHLLRTIPEAFLITCARGSHQYSLTLWVRREALRT